jgi:hypothetical protein
LSQTGLGPGGAEGFANNPVGDRLSSLSIHGLEKGEPRKSRVGAALTGICEPLRNENGRRSLSFSAGERPIGKFRAWPCEGFAKFTADMA